MKRCILFEVDGHAYVFPCSSLEDGSATGDYWFETSAKAEEFCRDEFGISANDWAVVDDPLPYCQHDWLAPVRVKGRVEGKPQWGVLERLENGIWVEFKTYDTSDS